MQQQFTVEVNKSEVSIEVIMNLTGTVIVTVKDPLGNPIQNASVQIDTTVSTTDASGIAVLKGLSYGNKTGVITLPGTI